MTRGRFGRRLDELERRADVAAGSAATPKTMEDFIILVRSLDRVRERWRAASERLGLGRGDIPSPDDLVGDPGVGYRDRITGAWICDDREIRLVRLWHPPDTDLRARQLLGLRGDESGA